MQKIRFITAVMVGLYMQFFWGFAFAIPMQQEIPDDNSVEIESMTPESLMAQDDFKLEKQGRDQVSKQDEGLAFPSANDVYSATDVELKYSKGSIYFEDKKNRDKQQFYSSYNKEPNPQPTLNLMDESEPGLPFLRESFADDSELKEKIKESMESIKKVKDALTINNEVGFGNNTRNTNRQIERDLYRNEQQKNLVQKDKSSKYSSSVVQEFFSKVLTFALYAVLGIVLIKLLLMFIAWQRKLHKY